MELDEASPRAANDAPLAILRLSLGYFRSWRSVEVESGGMPVVVVGPNGSGKTNLLEALSLLVPGRGLRRGTVADMQMIGSLRPWTVFAEVNACSGALRVGTGRSASSDEGEEADRRIVHIDGCPVKSQQTLADHIAMAWITPDMDRVLAEGSGARRKLLDRLAYGFDPSHLGRVQRYEKAMRERLRLLRDGAQDAVWLDALEDTMSTSAVAIAAARTHMLEVLAISMADTASEFPQADLGLLGAAENALADKPALAVEDMLRAGLKAARAEDARTGTCSIGAHRSDMTVIHAVKKCPADLCSTGEQKALLISLMLAYVRAVAKARRMLPILLLDDIAAHLDDTRRSALYEEILSLGVQAWMTGTDTGLFRDFLPHARLVETV